MSSGTPQATSNNSPAASLSPSSSSSLVKLDELSSFGATKQNRLPALIKLNQQQQQPLADQTNNTRAAPNSMPDFSASQLEQTVAKSPPMNQQQQSESLPVQLNDNNEQQSIDKENAAAPAAPATTIEQQQQQQQQRTADDSDDFQVVDMDDSTTMADLMGPSLPAPNNKNNKDDNAGNSMATEAMEALQNLDAKSLSAQLQSTQLGNNNNPQYASHLGDSLIEMVINLRNENQNLIRALETNNEYVKERLQEFKRVQEEAKRREAQFALEKAEHEHQSRKLRRQNDVLSERLKSMEAKLKEMKLEVSESLSAAHSSKASSLRGHEGELYPQLGADGTESFSNAALDAAAAAQDEQTTMQIDATSGELYNRDDDESTGEDTGDEGDSPPSNQKDQQQAASSGTAQRVGSMSKEELERRFDAQKAEFYALDDDPMKQCDQLEQQLNDIGKRDYEICLLQQQLNIYRQDFRLERMAKLEAKIQIERLKNDIDRLCLERIQQREREQERTNRVHFQSNNPSQSQTSAGSQACHLVGKLGHHLSKKAVRSAAKAAKYAAKQAHLEEKAAAALARATAAKQAAASHFGGNQQQHQQQYNQQPASSSGSEAAAAAAASDQHGHSRGHHRHHSYHHRRSVHGSRNPRAPGLGSEVVNDLLSTANKAMLTGYKMASTHVNLALDKLSQFEQQQAQQLDPFNKPPIQTPRANISGGTMASPSAPPVEPPSID